MAIRTGLKRVHVVCSVLTTVWLLLMLMPLIRGSGIPGHTRENDVADFVVNAVLPVAAYWVLVWIVAGFLKDRGDNSE